MPYLNLDIDYFSHPKTVRLAALLGEQAAIFPLKLWCYVGKFHSETGALDGYSVQEIESIAGWKGEQGKMVDVMLRDGIALLEKTEQGYKIHDWLEHAGHLSVFKKRAKSAAKKRWKSYATSTAKRKPKHAPNHTNPILTKPDLTEPNQANPLTLASGVKPVAKSAEVMAAYSEEYEIRWGAPPVKNATTNAIMCKVVDKLGREEAPHVARFYVRHNSQWYVSKMHPPNLLLQDAEKLRTEWATGRTMTQAKAQQADRTATTGDIFRKLINEEAEKRERKYAEIAGGGVRTDEHDAIGGGG